MVTDHGEKVLSSCKSSKEGWALQLKPQCNSISMTLSNNIATWITYVVPLPLRRLTVSFYICPMTKLQAQMVSTICFLRSPGLSSNGTCIGYVMISITISLILRV
jgi:hypothetical protein